MSFYCPICPEVCFLFLWQVWTPDITAVCVVQWRPGKEEGSPGEEDCPGLLDQPLLSWVVCLAARPSLRELSERVKGPRRVLLLV